MKQVLQAYWRRLRASDGSSTVEFVIWFPLFMTLFLTSFELSFYGMRSMMLERALDLNVRDLRLGISRPANLADLKKAICQDTILFRNCEEEISVDLRLVDQGSWSLPTGPIPCVDRAQNIKPLTSYSPGGGGDLMLVRACLVRDPFFATTPYVMGLPRDPSGGVSIVAVSTFVNEP